MSSDPSVRLMRLACDVDDLSVEIDDAPLTIGDTILLASPRLHLAIALERLDDKIRRVETPVMTPQVLDWLRLEAEERDAA